LNGEVRAEDFFTKGNWEIKEANAEYKILESDLPIDEGETIIILEGIKEQIHKELNRESKVWRTIEGSGYEKFKWTLAQYCPIEFPPDRNDLREFFGVRNRVPMGLWLDGVQLFRNVPEKTAILEKETKDFGKIKLKYVIMTPYKAVQPEEMRRLQVRLRDVAIGFPRDFEVTKLGRVLGKLNMLCGEVHILAGLDNALLVDRERFNFTEEVSDMYDFFRQRLTSWAKQLDEMSDSDKDLYLALGDLREDTRVTNDLLDAGVVHFSKEQMRLSEGLIRKPANESVENSMDTVINVLSRKLDKKQKIIKKKGAVSSEGPAIRYENESHTIIVFENHPSFVETIEYGGRLLRVKYDEWNPSGTAFRICRLSKDKTTVTFNRSNPLFQSKLNHKIVKHLAMGILIILDKTENSEELINNFNKLMEDTFAG